MKMGNLSSETLTNAAGTIGDGPVVMINLLSFRAVPRYPDGFENAKTTSRSAYYEGYASAFQQIALALGISTKLLYIGSQLTTLLPEEREPWDEIVMVRYNSFSELRLILDHPDYSSKADPHREAAVESWRFIASRSAT